MRKKISIIAFFLLFLTSIIYIFNNNTTMFEDCEILLKKNYTKLAEKNVIECYNLVAIKYANNKSPEFTLNYLKKYIKNTKNIELIDCHSILHSIGSKFYEIYKSKSLIPNMEICSYGYYHGIFQEANIESFEKYNNILSNICKNKTGENLNFCKAAVSHGFGHFLSNSNNTLFEALKKCDLILNEIAIEKENCAYGVVMEKIELTDEKINLNSCINNLSNDIIAGCLLGLGQHSLKNNINFIDSCPDNSLTLLYEKCSRGLGFAIASSLLYNLNNNYNINEYTNNMIRECANNDSCSSGAGSILTSTIRNLDTALSYCKKYFEIKNCSDAVNKLANLENI